MDVKAARNRCLGCAPLLVICCVCFPLKAATQGQAGITSSGSFSITLTIHPTLQTRIGSAEEELTSAKISNDIDVDKPKPFCVSGRGIGRFSLTGAGQAGNNTTQPAYNIGLLAESGELIEVKNDLNNARIFKTEENCLTPSRQLSIKVNHHSLLNKSLPGAIDLTIHAE